MERRGLGYDYVRQEFVGGNVLLHVRPKGKLVRCPCCRSRDVLHRGVSKRWLRTVPVGFKPVWLVDEVPRIGCASCGLVRRIELRIAEPRRRHTKAFARFVLALTKAMTMLDVAMLLGVGWDVVKDILKRHLHRRFGKPSLAGLEYIAIDEISVRKGHKYLTLVMDLRSGKVVFVGDGRGADSLRPFWERLKRSRARIRAVATDMSAAYIGSVLEHLPGVAVVLDHFHVVKLMNDRLTEVRRMLHRELQDKMGKNVLKGSRWILLKNLKNLNPERQEHERLQEALGPMSRWPRPTTSKRNCARSGTSRTRPPRPSVSSSG